MSSAEHSPIFTSLPQVQLREDELRPGHRPSPVNVCEELDFSVAAVGWITERELDGEKPVSPADRPEMCVYGGTWDDPQALFDALAPQRKSSRGASSQVPTSISDSDAATPAIPVDPILPTEDSVFVSARRINDDTGSDLLATIAAAIGLQYECTAKTPRVTVPEIFVPDPVTGDGAGSTDRISALGPISGFGYELEADSAADTGANSVSDQSESIVLSVLQCTSFPTASGPHSQVFFRSGEILWQVSVVSPNTRTEQSFAHDESAVLSLAAAISERNII